MNGGRPIPVFDQEDPTPERLSNEGEDNSEDADSSTAEPAARPPVDALGNRLKFSSTWVEEPVFEHQARLYPDSVKVVAEKYKVFDMSSEADMEEYSKLRLSNALKGKFCITSDEFMQWSEAKSTWLVAFRVQERMFKTHLTSNQSPSDDS